MKNIGQNNSSKKDFYKNISRVYDNISPKKNHHKYSQKNRYASHNLKKKGEARKIPRME
jgi:hypothetical protein